MSDWNRTIYRCVICDRPYDDYLGGSFFCSIGCREEYEALWRAVKRNREGDF